MSKNVVTLKSGSLRGHSRSLKVVPFDIVGWFPISVLCNFVPKIFLRYLTSKNVVTLKTGLANITIR